jgi:hypothetical protein
MKALAAVTAFLLAAAFAFRTAAAEVAPVPKEDLQRQAGLVVTGRVTAVESDAKRVDKDGSGTERFNLRLSIAEVEKGAADKAKPIVVTGWRHTLKPGETGSTGHRSFDGKRSLSDVRAGWVVRVYLKSSDTGDTYDILFPNGFVVVAEDAERKAATSRPAAVR